MIITGGKYKGRKVLLPDENIVRPTLSQIRESVFSSLFSITGKFEGKSFLDAFAGSGIMGLEALSRGFEKIIAVEKNLKVVKILKENYLKLKIEPNILIGDTLKKIEKFNETFDVIYLDPPYKSGIYELILKKVCTIGEVIGTRD
ncbi:MAG TPA: 16S rRNA (guanine(966)-N(2))-methyltransferase RsmD, partial [Candidatus Gastranaerophilaceae bacterium]|nr:16S rRNA (guanine(966)-N(2))-methyltransferase RsmD [Candidatus Gastranaerophilaceae bacterium]